MRVAVTGANGFVGRAVTSAIGTAGWDPVPIRRSADNGLELRTIEDPWSPAEWRVSLRGVHAVVHLIGPAHRSSGGGDDLDAFVHVNVGVASALISAMESIDLGALVYMSSVKAVGEVTENRPIDASTPARPSSPDGVSKLRAEEMLSRENDPEYS